MRLNACTSLILLAMGSPALPQGDPASPAETKAEAPAPKKTRKICYTVADTGSIMRQRVCRTVTVTEPAQNKPAASTATAQEEPVSPQGGDKPATPGA